MSGLVGRLLNKILKLTAPDLEERPFYRVSFRWWGPLDVVRLADEFSGEYEVELRPNYIDEGRIEIYPEDRREVRIRADTLYAFITAYRAVLFQKQLASFTDKDEVLKDYVMKNYPHWRDTPFL